LLGRFPQFRPPTAQPDGSLVPSTAIGNAKQISGGKLEVSFFGPFYGPYWIIDLWGPARTPATGYDVAVIFSCSSVFNISSTDLWVLSRTPQLPKETSLERIKQIVEGQVSTSWCTCLFHSSQPYTALTTHLATLPCATASQGIKWDNLQMRTTNQTCTF
jgi:hypothetical protein